LDACCELKHTPELLEGVKYVPLAFRLLIKLVLHEMCNATLTGVSITNTSFPCKPFGKCKHLLPLQPKMLSCFVDPVALCGSPHRNVISVPKDSKKSRVACFLVPDISLAVITTLMASKSDEMAERSTLNLDEMNLRHLLWRVFPVSRLFVASAPLQSFIQKVATGYPKLTGDTHDASVGEYLPIMKSGGWHIR